MTMYHLFQIALLFQSKVDNLGMYHTLAKGLKHYNGSTYIKQDLGIYVEQHKEKYKVRILMLICSSKLIFTCIYNHELFNG